MSSSAPADSTAEALTGIIVHHPDRLLEEIERAGLLHLDETPWRKSSQLLWLWVFNAVATVVYFIGARSAEIFITSFRAVRDGPSDDLTARQAPVLAQLQGLCERHPHSPFVKPGEFCREMLIAWEAIIRPLLDPSLPLTDNAAERLLRHWVIARRPSFGTGSEQRTGAFALLARTIDTCRARNTSAWDCCIATVQAGRQGVPMPSLPAVSAGGGIIGYEGPVLFNVQASRRIRGTLCHRNRGGRDQ